MSFISKDNGREYSNRTNSNPNKMQSMNNRNLNSSQSYSNSNNVENYSYEAKGQRGCNSPKQNCDIHNNNPQNTNTREHYPYKTENARARHYPGKYSNDRPNYYSQQSNSPTDIVVIPEIETLKEFIREQSEHFKFELNKYEECKSSPSPRSNYYQDQGQQRQQQRLTTGQNRNTMSTSNSLGTISCSNSNFSNPSFASTAMSNLDKQSNNYQNKSNYNKTVQSSGKSNNNNLTRNLSHDETFSKATPINKNRVGSPNNSSEKSPGNNKSQFTNTSNTGGTRQDSKPDMNKVSKHGSYTFGAAAHFQTSQQNTNNQVTAPSSYANKTNQQTRISNMNASVGCPKNTSPNSYETHKNSSRINGDSETGKSHRVEVRVSDNARHMSNSGNTTDSQDVDYGTPDSPVSPCSLRLNDDVRNGIAPRQTNNKKGQ